MYYDENKPIKLEIYHAPTQGIIANMYFQYDVIWGRDANGYEFTLFNVSIDNPMQEDCVADFSKMEFNVDYVILGRHVQSMDEPIFDICTVKFPYLKNWAFQDNREEERNGKLISCTLDLRKGDPFLETEIEDGIKIALVPYSEYIPARYDTTVAQNTYLRVSANVFAYSVSKMYKAGIYKAKGDILESLKTLRQLKAYLVKEIKTSDNKEVLQGVLQVVDNTVKEVETEKWHILNGAI